MYKYSFEQSLFGASVEGHPPRTIVYCSFDFSDFVIIAELQALITNFYGFSLPEVNLFTSSSGKKTNLYLDRFSPISGTFLSGYLGLKKCRLHTLSVMLVCH